MKKFDVPNNDLVEEENVDSKPEMTFSDIDNDKEKNKESKSNYDQPASQEEISELREKIEEKVENKAKKLNISKEKLIELADLDLESLEAENLKDLNQGGLEFTRDSIDRAINEFWRSEKTRELVTGTTSKLEGSINEAFEFAKKHKKVVSLGELALYASSFGPAVLKDLAGDNAQVKIGEQKISLKDLADNPELIKWIKNGHTNLPVEIWNEDQQFERNFENYNIEFSLKVIEKETEGDVREKYVYFDMLKHLHTFDKTVNEEEMFDNLKKDLSAIGISLNSQDGGCSMDKLLSNMAKISDIISENLEIPKGEVENYLEIFLMAETSKFSVIEITDLDNMRIKNNIETLEKTKLQKEHDRMFFEILGSPEGTIGERSQKFHEEWLKWGKENGYEDVEQSLRQEEFNYKKSTEGKFEKIKSEEERQIAEFENMEEFEEIVLEKLKKNGYSIDELKEIAEDDPLEIYSIIAKIIGEEVEYDWMVYSKDVLNIISKGKIVSDEDVSRNASELPYNAIKDGKVVCDGKALTFMAFKNILEKNGVPNLDKTAVLDTYIETWHGIYGHACNVIYFVDEDDNLVIVPFDITFLGDEDLSKISDKINVMNKNYNYSIIKKVDETHDKTLEKIKDYNILAFQEELKKILMQYDPKHKPEIKVDKKAFEEITKKKTKPSREDKKNAVNSLS